MNIQISRVVNDIIQSQNVKIKEMYQLKFIVFL